MQYFSDEQLDDMFRLLDFDQLEQLGYKMDIYTPDELEDFMITIDEEFSELDREDKIAELQQIGAFDDDYLVDEVKMGAETKRERLKREREEREMDDAATDVDYMREHYAEDIPVWNSGIVQYETSGPMSPTGSGYSSASAPPYGVFVDSGDTFLNYTEVQQDMVESSGGLYGAESDDPYDPQRAHTFTYYIYVDGEHEDTGKITVYADNRTEAYYGAHTALGEGAQADEEFEVLYESEGNTPNFTPDDGYKCDVCKKTIVEGVNLQDIDVHWYITDGSFNGNYDMKNHLGGYNNFYCYTCAENEGFMSEESSTPVMDPMEFGEMANWKPMDGTPGLKRQRAESDAFIYAYNEGHSDARRDAGYNVRRTERELTQFKKIFKQAEEFAADSPFNTLLEIREDIIIDDEQDFDRLLSLYMSLESDIAAMYQTMDNPKHPLLEEMIRYRNQIANRLDELQERVEIQEEILMDAEQRRLADPTVPIQLEKPFRTGYKLGFGAIAAAFTIPLALLGLGAIYNREQQ